MNTFVFLIDEPVESLMTVSDVTTREDARPYIIIMRQKVVKAIRIK